MDQNRPRSHHDAPADLSRLRSQFGEQQGRQFWRSLDELADTAEVRRYVHEEFPRLAQLWDQSLDRRGFLRLMAASLALAGVSGCGREPMEPIVPYVYAQPGVPAGESVYYATATLRDGYAVGTLVEKFMGRPIKVEGNPNHPASLGATDIFGQASVLQLWDPERAATVRHQGRIAAWGDFQAQVMDRLRTIHGDGGEGLRILTGTVTSPTLAGQIQDFLRRYPNAQWHQYQPLNQDNTLNASRLAFPGKDALTPVYSFEQARVVVTLDGDFLSEPAGRLRYARDFSRLRRMDLTHQPRNRLYAFESVPGLAGAAADERWALRPSEISAAAAALAAALGLPVSAVDSPLGDDTVRAVVQDLRAHAGQSLVVAGERQPPHVHALAYLMNETLGNLGRTIRFIPSVEARAEPHAASLRRLAQDINAGRVQTLVIFGGNPVYTAPADLEMEALLQRVPFSAYLSLYPDETAQHVTWHIPQTHTYESWSDARAYDGTITIVQPMIAPLYGGHSEHELLGLLLGDPAQTAHQAVTSHWRARLGEPFLPRWQQILRDGLIGGSEARPVSATVDRRFLEHLPAPPQSEPKELEISFAPDPTVWDGEYAGLGWLQELPKPLTKLTWDNAALIGVETAARLGLENEEVVELHYRGRSVRAPVWVLPGHPEEVVTATLGYGHWSGSRLATGNGYNAYAIRTSGTPWFGRGVELRKTGQRFPLATAQHHHSMEGRPLIRTATLEEYRKNPDFAREEPHTTYPKPTLYPEYAYNEYKWGMTVDLNTCIGCAACVVACQAENNIPVVGKEQVMMAREMQWLRIDRYYEGPPDKPRTHFQPVPCMQCEKAPCEPVCPVEASVHDSEGINVQVYNRCIGTRFCSNNCPYKVRRFNFLQYAQDIPALNAMRNPEVTVRMRGVMEKCNYCLQRISNARIEAKKENRRIRDGEVLTACQAVCPTQAIVFGDLNEPGSQVIRLKQTPLNYSLLAELGTVPRTTYLAKVTNPNPAIEDGG